ncbi:hypothetical protein [Chelatococcus reniformis]|uniref:Uncharacterized protein n=1 Tax=Chelatococcus reniformis TaxID=1494448 RepID=A0A916UYD8_9HYPH|nr:hypothetical protein [Chelatococcus reniformis]GGC94630.1 hypothetical protein GCM10010994_60480 [Chelatococcus reniformis]
MTPEAIEIRDAAVVLLQNPQMFKLVSINPVDVEPDDQLPSLLVLAWREQAKADGDAVSGEPHFVHDLSLVLNFKVRANRREDLPTSLHKRMRWALNKLLTSPDWLAHVEGVTSLSSSVAFPREGENWYAQGTTELQVQFSTRWEPVVPDDYLGTDLIARPLGHDANTPEIRVTLDQVQPD